MEPLHCTGKNTNNNNNDNSSSASAIFCPKLAKDRIGEYQVYRDGMSLADVMYAYVMKEPYVDQVNWSLGFCLHSDWVWGCKTSCCICKKIVFQWKFERPGHSLSAWFFWSLTFRMILHTKLNQTDLVNYYNISTALGRRRHDVPVDRLGAYNGSEISPFTDQYRRQCDFDSNEHCPVDAHMCHYVTPDHMRHLWFHNNNKQSTTDKTWCNDSNGLVINAYFSALWKSIGRYNAINMVSRL